MILSNLVFNKLPVKTELDEKDIEFIQANTTLSREQILKWYDEFIASCPQKKLDQTSFVRFFSKLFPNESNKADREAYCKTIFKACIL